MSTKRDTDEAGFTLVELSVAATLTLLLSGILFSAYALGVERTEEWRRGVAAENTAHVVLRRISTDLASAEDVYVEEEGSWVLQVPAGEQVRYAFADSRLTRNGVLMHDSTLSIETFGLNLTADSVEARERVFGDPGGQQPLRLVSAWLTLRHGRRAVSLSTSVALRQAQSWVPLSTRLHGPSQPPRS